MKKRSSFKTRTRKLIRVNPVMKLFYLLKLSKNNEQKQIILKLDL